MINLHGSLIPNKASKENRNYVKVSCQFCHKEMILTNKYIHMLRCRYFRIFLNNPYLHTDLFSNPLTFDKNIIKKKNRIIATVPKIFNDFEIGFEGYYLYNNSSGSNQKINEESKKELLMENLNEIKKRKNVKEALLNL